MREKKYQPQTQVFQLDRLGKHVFHRPAIARHLLVDVVRQHRRRCLTRHEYLYEKLPEERPRLKFEHGEIDGLCAGG